MWNKKTKAVTFSFDDGVTQDVRLIEILNRYGLKATFNINSSLLGIKRQITRNGVEVSHIKNKAKDVARIYAGHEVAVHTLTHPNLTEQDDDTVIYQVESDRQKLSELCGYEVIGMAYPCGGVNNDDRVAKIIRENTSVRYSRTITSTYNFEPQENLYRFNPTVYYIEVEKLFELGQKFLELPDDGQDRIFYIWGHSYEMDAGYISWEKFEEFCRMISGHEDIFYGTNKEVLLAH